jgi:transcriptional regulator with GAF, ATPase, and Fis domain
VFLDEVGELPLSMQPKLLRVLESGTVRRLGETAHRAVRVRFVSATHRDLLRMVSRGQFREDLFFRLSVLPVFVPPLRDRREDVPLLAQRFAGEGVSLPPDLVARLENYPWRGNVRELRNVLERLRALGPESLRLATDGFDDAETTTGVIAVPPELKELPAIADPSGSRLDQPLRKFREELLERGEREYVTALLARHNGNVVAAAAAAEVDRTHIYRLIRKLGL